MTLVQTGRIWRWAVRAVLVRAVIAQAAHTGAADVPPIVISATAAGDTITIRGVNLGTGLPRVMLNATELLVLSHSPGEIVARLPEDLPPASYLLAVYRTGASTTHLPKRGRRRRRRAHPSHVPATRPCG